MQTAVLNETTQLNEMTQQLPFFAKENPHQKLEQIHTVDAVEADWYFSKVSVLLSGIVHLLAVWLLRNSAIRIRRHLAVTLNIQSDKRVQDLGFRVSGL